MPLRSVASGPNVRVLNSNGYAGWVLGVEWLGSGGLGVGLVVPGMRLAVRVVDDAAPASAVQPVRRAAVTAADEARTWCERCTDLPCLAVGTCSTRASYLWLARTVL
jgi:hypothetical protein